MKHKNKICNKDKSKQPCKCNKCKWEPGKKLILHNYFNNYFKWFLVIFMSYCGAGLFRYIELNPSVPGAVVFSWAIIVFSTIILIFRMEVGLLLISAMFIFADSMGVFNSGIWKLGMYLTIISVIGLIIQVHAGIKFIPDIKVIEQPWASDNKTGKWRVVNNG